MQNAVSLLYSAYFRSSPLFTYKIACIMQYFFSRASEIRIKTNQSGKSCCGKDEFRIMIGIEKNAEDLPPAERRNRYGFTQLAD